MIRVRDLMGSLTAWLQFKLAGDPNVIPGGVRFDTDALDAYAVLSMTHTDDPGPWTSVRSGRGVIDLDVRSARTVSSSGLTREVALLETTIDKLRDALTRENVPVWDLFGFDAVPGKLGTLNGTIAAGASSVVVTGGASFDAGPKNLTIDGELIQYTTVVIGGGDSATFSGLTRGAGKTVAAAHTNGANVADALGEPVGFIRTDGFDDNLLPFDVAQQRNRAIVRVPFVSTYSIGS